jgi:hypothetical protein
VAFETTSFLEQSLAPAGLFRNAVCMTNHDRDHRVNCAQPAES